MSIHRKWRHVGLSVSLFLTAVCLCSETYAASTPNVNGGFTMNDDDFIEAYEEAYGWNEDVFKAYSWYHTGPDGSTYYFSRQTGYQKEFLKDNIMTTRQYLGLYVDGSGNGSDIVAIAKAELGLQDSIESPLGSDNVKYNTWYYGHSVRNIDTNKNGKYDYGDSAYYPWCCVFVDWCANECGYIDSGLFPLYASCNLMYSYMTIETGFDSVPVLDTTPMGGSAYTPVPGDLMFFVDNRGSGYGHIGIISDIEADGFWTVEGNSNYRVSHNYYHSGSEYRAIHGTIVHVIYPDSGGEERSAQIYRYLTETMRLTPPTAAGILGNMQDKSGCVPNTTENGLTWENGAGYGLLQWTNTDAIGRVIDEGTMLRKGDGFYFQNGLRRTNLVNYCVTNNLDYRDLNGQLAFLKAEMSHYSTYSNAITKMNQCAQTLEGAQEACLIWLEYIEGLPRTDASWSLNARVRKSFTEMMYNKYVLK